MMYDVQVWNGRAELTDTVTSDARFAFRRRDEIRRNGTPARVLDRFGVELELIA